MIKQILKNITFMTASKILAQLFAFISTVWIARVLGVENYGKIGYVTALIVYFDMFSNLGLETYSIREVVRDNTKLSLFVNHTISLRLIASCILYLIIFILHFFISQSGEVRTLLLLYGLNLFFKSLSINWAFASENRLDLYGYTQILLQFIYMVGVILFVNSPDDLYLVPISFLMANFISLFYPWFMHRSKIKFPRLQFQPTLWKEMLKISLPIITSYVIIKIYLTFGLIYLGFLGREAEAGLLNAAFKFLFMLIAIREVLISISFPLMSKYFVESHEKLNLIMEKFVKLSILFAFPVVVGGWYLAPDLVNTIFGEQYQGASIVIRILLVGYFLMMLNIVFPSSLNAFNRQQLYFKISLLNSILNIIFNILFIHLWGFVGAALAVALTEFCSFIFYKYESNKVVKIGIFDSLQKTLLPTTLMFVALYFLPEINVFFKIGVSSVIYLVGLFIFNAFTLEERRILRELIFTS